MLPQDLNDCFNGINNYGCRWSLSKGTKTRSGVWVVLDKTVACKKVKDSFHDLHLSNKKITALCSTDCSMTSSHFLNKIVFSLCVTKDALFTKLVSLVSCDPTMKQFLVKSKQWQEAVEHWQTRRNIKIIATRLLSSCPASSLTEEKHADTTKTACTWDQNSSIGEDVGNRLVSPLVPGTQGFSSVGSGAKSASPSIWWDLVGS